MHRKFLPRIHRLATELAWLILWSVSRLMMTVAHQSPYLLLAVSGFLGGAFTLSLGLGNLVLAHEMLNKVILAVAFVLAFFDCAGPPAEMAVPLVLVADPVSLSLEGFRLFAVAVSAGKWRYIFMNMLRPVRGLLELLHAEA
jgi:hypothetical protein